MSHEQRDIESIFSSIREADVLVSRGDVGQIVKQHKADLATKGYGRRRLFLGCALLVVSNTGLYMYRSQMPSEANTLRYADIDTQRPATAGSVLRSTDVVVFENANDGKATSDAQYEYLNQNQSGSAHQDASANHDSTSPVAPPKVADTKQDRVGEDATSLPQPGLESSTEIEPAETESGAKFLTRDQRFESFATAALLDMGIIPNSDTYSLKLTKKYLKVNDVKIDDVIHQAVKERYESIYGVEIVGNSFVKLDRINGDFIVESKITDF